jgi:proteasome lid subunit RPN8/RPN11
MLKLQASDYDKIRRHGEETYPDECCGILVGMSEGDIRSVQSVVCCNNTRTDSPQNRYHIDPRELVHAQCEARERGLDIVGFYHSHPDHPAQWSPTDLEEAHWIGCSYVITAVEEGKATQTKSFALTGSREEDKALVKEELSLIANR